MLRRLGTFTAVGVALPLWLVLSPIWIPISLLADVAGRLFRFPTVRLATGFGVYLVHEWVGMVAGLWWWIVGGFGRNPHLGAHRRVQAWWATSLLRSAGRLLGVRVAWDSVDGIESIPDDRFILLSRHASMADALLPAALVAGRLDRFVHYVIKRELRFDPNIDLFGTRLGNYFVERGADTEREAQSIRRLAEQALPGSALVIFPEGTYSTEATRRRVRESLEARGETELATLACSLDALLPPRPAGTLALLAGRPEADVVIVGHVGPGGGGQPAGTSTTAAAGAAGRAPLLAPRPGRAARRSRRPGQVVERALGAAR